MGSAVSMINNVLYTKLRSIFSGSSPHSIAMVGLDGAGKTTLLMFLQTGETHKTIPTLGFNLDEVKVGNTTFKIWDIGGQHIFMKFWPEYIKDNCGIVYLVDCADSARFNKSGEELWNLLRNLEKSKPLLVLINKTDLIKEQHKSDNVINNIKEVFNLERYHGSWLMVPISVIEAGSMGPESEKSGNDILNAFKWLSQELSKASKADG